MDANHGIGMDGDKDSRSIEHRDVPPSTGGPDALRQGVAVGFYEFVDHLGDLVEREDARSVAVEHGGVIDVVPPTLQSRPDCEVLNSGVRRAGGGALRRKVPDVAGTQTGVVD